jgi:AcrR family transcriptional regulator
VVFGGAIPGGKGEMTMAESGRKVQKKAEDKVKPTTPEKESWQGKKSAMTRASILEAAIECFVKSGYKNTTTSRIAEEAGVSRGAMLHHFPSRDAVIKGAVLYLQEKRLKEYKVIISELAAIPENGVTSEVVKDAIRATWKYFNLPSFFAYNELLVASRTDQDLAKIFYPQQKMFEQQFFETVKAIYPLWGNMGQALELGSDVVFLTMQGMATSFMRYHKKERVEHILEYLEKQVIDIYESKEI